MSWLREMWTVLRAYVPTIVVGALLFVVLFLVPQVASLFPSRRELLTLPIRIFFYLFVFLIGASYCIGFLWIMEPRLVRVTSISSFRATIKEVVDESQTERASQANRSQEASTTLMTDLLTLCQNVWLNIHWQPVCLLLGLAGICAGSTFLFGTSIKYAEFLDVPVRWTVVVFLLLWAAYFAFGSSLPDSTGKLVGRALFAFMAFGIAGEVLWYLGLHWNFTSPRIYSIGAICYLLLLVLTSVAFIDRWQSLAPEWPVRLFFVVGVMLLSAILLRSPTIGATVALKADAVKDPVEEWLKMLDIRIHDPSLPQTSPVILVAAAGGGSRAALFAALVLEKMDTADFGKSTTPIGRPPSAPFQPAQQIVLISSVSGGSLTSACYTDSNYRTADKARSKIKNYYPGAMVKMIQKEISDLELDYLRTHFPELFGAQLNEDELKAALDKKKEQLSKGDRGFLESRLVDDMCADFMAPLLRGVIHPGRERGESVTDFWEQQFSQPKGKAPSTPVPLWMSNTTDVSTGGPLVLGVPPMPPQLIRLGDKPDIALNQDTSSWELSRWQAARLSANFPWGFQVANSPLKIQRTSREASNPSATGQIRLHLIDGGVFDNTGITTIRSLFQSIQQLSANSIDSPVKTLATKILETLRERGVILVEIDSGAKPEPPSGVSKFFDGVLEPISALSNATYHTSQRANLDNIQALREIFRDPHEENVRLRLQYSFPNTPNDDQKKLIHELSQARIDSFQHVKITCNDQDNVMTAWALPPEEKAKIFVRFIVAVEQFEEELAGAAYRLVRTKELTHELAKRVSTIPGEPSLDRFAEIEDRAVDYLLLAKSMKRAQIAQENKAVSEQLYAQNASLKQYKEFEMKKEAQFDGVFEAIRRRAMNEDAQPYSLDIEMPYSAGVDRPAGVSAPAAPVPSSAPEPTHVQPTREVNPKGGIKPQGADPGSGSGGYPTRTRQPQSEYNDDLELVSRRLARETPQMKAPPSDVPAP